MIIKIETKSFSLANLIIIIWQWEVEKLYIHKYLKIKSFFFFLMQLLETTLAFKEHVLGPKLIENKMEVSIHLSVYFLWHFYSITV